MRVLVALPYGPSQTRVRSRMLLNELSQHHEITLVTLGWNASDIAASAEWATRVERVIVVPHGRAEIARALLRYPRLPLQYAISRSSKMSQAIRKLVDNAHRENRPYAAVHVEHLRGAAATDLVSGLNARTVFDAVDCIAELARLARLSSPSRMVRITGRAEERSTRKLETQIVSLVGAATVVAERDRQALVRGGVARPIYVVPNGVATRGQPVALSESPTIVFSGKLSYHANNAALRWFVSDVFPKVRSAIPNATLVVVGANAPTWLHQATEMSGIELIENPTEIEPWIEQARVSVAPIRYSVGVQNKILEALGRGVPVVATKSAAEGLPSVAADCLLIADSADDFAAQVVQLINDRPFASQLGARGHQIMQRHFRWSDVAATFERLYQHSPFVEALKVA